MTAVVLGAGGLLGRHVTAALRAAGRDLRALDRAACDVTDRDALRAGLRGATQVFNCAGFTRVDDAEDDPVGAARLNADAPAAIVRAADGARVIHVSTDFVFDGTATAPHDEDDPPHPLGVYGRTKRAGEVAALAAGPRVAVARVQALYGAGGTNLGSRLAGLLRAGRPLVLDAERVVQPTYVRAAAAQLVRLADSEVDGIVHVTCTGATTWADFATALAAHLGLAPTWRAVPSAEIPTRAPRPRMCALAHRRLRAAGIFQMPSWQDALATYVREEQP